MPLDSIPGVEAIVDNDRAFFTLWTKYGKWDSENPSMFKEQEVNRQDGALPGVDVPESCILLHLSDEDRGEYDLNVSSILIREDYLKTLQDICHFAAHSELPDTGSRSDKSPIAFSNPFLNNKIVSMSIAVILLGHPGIGKSLWLIFVLVLRILAGCPTIFHFRSNTCYLFNAQGLYKINLADEEFIDAQHHFRKVVSPQYWCLVDSNHSVPDVPPQLSQTRAFILQVASPRFDRVDWVKKHGSTTCRYFMMNPTLPELIMGRTLQPLETRCSEQALKLFYSRYAPSARMAYAYAEGIDQYEKIITEEISNLTFESFGKMLSSAEALRVENVSYHILLVSPGKGDRSAQSITISTRYVYDKLRGKLHIHTLEEAARLYQVFMCNQYTKASAGYILDDIHDVFCRGGEWQLTPMTKGKPGPINTHFKSPNSTRKSVRLRLGHGNQLIKIAKQRLPGGSLFTRLPRHRFLLGENIQLVDGYYQPAPGQPTFDGFIYDSATQTATMLQMTVATRHDVKVQCLTWLINRGAVTIHLVAVKPPNTSLNFVIPNALAPQIGKVYELVLKSLQE
ncbi:hypothetical protein D9615_006049 [Tricholomella constricta]|uniref:Crinkler (CRN) family protein n=1 Tax=Tricholomella constricta TaxID=117010 RepID=A0A8H5H962_9AGAR|nr:hypothetical protein D9615_006049 [Tricholomella constricta]